MSMVSRLREAARALPLDRATKDLVRRLTASSFGLGAWLRYGRGRRPGRARPGPVVVVGFHSSVLGLGDGVRAFSATLRQAGAEVIDWDIGEVFGHGEHLPGEFVMAPPGGDGPMVIHLNPPELIQLVSIYGAAPFEGRLVVGYWAWELETAPRSWAGAYRYVDEVWTPSNFVASAIGAGAPAATPVRVFPHPVSMLPRAGPDRARFGLPADALVVLTSFDIRSGFERKNPLAAVAAVRRAAQLSGQPLMLACKVVGREGAPDRFAELEALAGDAGDVMLITEWLSGEAMGSLIASADIVVSLHRSEGFGLLLAQAMLAAKPVVATGWSGNIDFMDVETARLVDFDLVPVQDAQGLYAGGHWAEAAQEDAARKLARLASFPTEREQLGAAAAAAIRERLDPRRWGAIARLWLSGE